MANAQTAYTELVARERERALLDSVRSTLDWDEATMMPSGGGALRSEQKALLAKSTHQMLAHPRTGELLDQLLNSDLMKQQPIRGNILSVKRSYDHATKIPTKLVEEKARLSTDSIEAWTNARGSKNFSIFKPYLEKMIGFCREEANAIGYQETPYDALLDLYEPGEKTENLRTVFQELKKEINSLLAIVEKSSKKPSQEFFKKNYPITDQKKLSEFAMVALGFNLDNGRLDLSTHPFCSGFWPGDVRLTSRYEENDFSGGLLSTFHETGHGMYEQGLSKENFGLAIGRACSMGIHESQSRLWENLVGRSPAFWDFFYPHAQKAFPVALKNMKQDDFVFALNGVEKSFIRTESDEVTYNLHIILRFEMEEALLRGDLQVSDVPHAWNQKFKELFGLTPPNDAMGCLQDIHWSTGDLGYFPTYTLGNLYGAQFMEKAREDLKNLEGDFRNGDFSKLRSWLAKNVYSYGQTLLAGELCEKATGKKLSAQPLLRHLRSKVTHFYS